MANHLIGITLYVIKLTSPKICNAQLRFSDTGNIKCYDLLLRSSIKSLMSNKMCLWEMVLFDKAAWRCDKQ